MRVSREPLGPTREVQILLPVSLLLLVALSAATLFAYRNSLDLLAEQHRSAALRQVLGAARLLSSPEEDPRQVLQELGPEVLAAAVLGPRGEILASQGDFPGGNLLAPFGREIPRGPRALGPSEATNGRVIAVVPIGGGKAPRALRIDLSGRVLASQKRSLGVLFPVVLGTDFAVLALVLFFLRHLVSPFEQMLARARVAGAAAETGQDETAFLLATFERALGALTDQRRPEQDAELGVLERVLTTNLDTGVLLLDAGLAVVSVNPAACQQLDLGTPSLPAPLEEALSREPALAAELAAAAREGKVIKRQEHLLGPRLLGYTATPLKRDDGALRGLLVLISDLTEVRRREEARQLEQGLAQLGEMSAGVAHELRNSVATLSGYLSLVERDDDPEAVKDYLGEIGREITHLRRVVEDFLAFARPGTARPEAVELEPMLRRIAADPALGGAAVRFDVAAGVPSPMADAQLLERALRNLLANAVEAERRGPCPGPVEVVLRPVEDGVEIRICDRGPGLPEEVRQRLFQPFVSGRPDGVGLGLSLAHRIVTLHRGALSLEDRSGGGTEARVFLPNLQFRVET
ncbi:MAG: ATP-binding protein [Thermoanaerobaculia bacterium]